MMNKMTLWFINLWNKLTGKPVELTPVNKQTVTEEKKKVDIPNHRVNETNRQTRPNYYSYDRAPKRILKDDNSSSYAGPTFVDNVTTGIVSGVVSAMVMNELSENDYHNNTYSENITSATPEVTTSNNIYDVEPEIISFASKSDDDSNYSSYDDSSYISEE